MLRFVLILALTIIASPAVTLAQGRQLADEGQKHIPNDTSGVYKAPYPPASG